MNLIVDRVPAPTGKGKAYRISQWRDGTCFQDLILSERQTKSLVNRLIKLLPPQPLNIMISKREVTARRRGLKMRTVTLPLREDASGLFSPGFCDPPTTKRRTLPPLEAVVTKTGVKIRRALSAKWSVESIQDFENEFP